MSIKKVIYTARAKAMGGRAGTAKSDDGQIDLEVYPNRIPPPILISSSYQAVRATPSRAASNHIPHH
jgi:hypothetical protein